MPGATFTTIEAIEHQAAACERVGSDLYGSLLRGVAADFLSGGISAELLEGVSDRPLHDAVPLRYLATAHRLALAGAAPDLAATYPSCGGQWSGDDITDTFLSVVAEHRGEFVLGLQRSVQTNEVGRAVCLVAGFSAIAAHHGSTALRTLEVGGVGRPAVAVALVPLRHRRVDHRRPAQHGAVRCRVVRQRAAPAAVVGAGRGRASRMRHRTDRRHQ